MHEHNEYGSSCYIHVYDETGRLRRCSEAVDMGHNMPDGSVLPTGFGFCPHLDEEWGRSNIVEVDS